MSPRLEANDLECVRGDRVLFNGLSFSLSRGELLEVTGPNGSGKTSLLRMLCGLLAPVAGEIRWEGVKITSIREEYLNNLTYLAHSNGIKGELSAVENLRIQGGIAGARPRGTNISTALDRLGLDGSERTPTRILSQGQQRRLALARLLVSGKALWILDEPLTALDTSAVRLVQSILEEHLEGGGIAVLTTHHPLQIKAAGISRIDLALRSEH